MERLCKIRDLQHAVARFEAAFERRYGLCLNEGMTLCTLSRSGRLCPGELGERLGLTPSNTSKVLRAVESKGLVKREPGCADRRQMYYSLTGEGRALLAALDCREVEIPPLLRELLPEMAQLPPDTRADTTDRSVVFFLPAGIPLALCLLLTAVSRTTLPALTLPLLIPTGVFAALLGAAAVGWHREGVWQQQGQLLLCRQHRFHLHQLCVFHPDTGFTALQSPWAVTVQRANLTLVFPGKEKVTVRSVPLAALDFLEI